MTRLLEVQAPHLAHHRVHSTGRATSGRATSGSSNRVFRLGDDLAVRLPRSEAYVGDLRTEVRWLPRLGPELPVPVPVVVHVGEPSALFPRPWAVVSWLAGEPPGPPEVLDDDVQAAFATSLGELLVALHGVDIGDVPSGSGHWGYRGGDPVTGVIDAWADEAAQDLADLFDPAAVRRAWRRLREVPPPTGPPCWVHTDLSAENVLVGPDGRLVGVIDFGGLGVGDRSVDLLYAWSLLDGPERTRRLTRMVEAVAGEVGVRLR